MSEGIKDSVERLYEDRDKWRTRCLAAEAEVKQQGITIGYFQQKLDAAEAERDESNEALSEVLAAFEGVVRGKLTRSEAIELTVDAARKCVQERDQYKRESDALRAFQALKDSSLRKMQGGYWGVSWLDGHFIRGKTPLEAIENAVMAQRQRLEEVEASFSLRGLRSHVWTGCQQGGSPSDAGSYEWVRYCSVCGMEDTCEDPLPPCPGPDAGERPHDTEAKPEGRVAKSENVSD